MDTDTETGPLRPHENPEPATDAPEYLEVPLWVCKCGSGLGHKPRAGDAWDDWSVICLVVIVALVVVEIVQAATG